MASSFHDCSKTEFHSWECIAAERKTEQQLYQPQDRVCTVLWGHLALKKCLWLLKEHNYSPSLKEKHFSTFALANTYFRKIRLLHWGLRRNCFMAASSDVLFIFWCFLHCFLRPKALDEWTNDGVDKWLKESFVDPEKNWNDYTGNAHHGCLGLCGRNMLEH